MRPTPSPRTSRAPPGNRGIAPVSSAEWWQPPGGAARRCRSLLPRDDDAPLPQRELEPPLCADQWGVWAGAENVRERALWRGVSWRGHGLLRRRRSVHQRHRAREGLRADTFIERGDSTLAVQIRLLHGPPARAMSVGIVAPEKPSVPVPGRPGGDGRRRRAGVGSPPRLAPCSNSRAVARSGSGRQGAGAALVPDDSDRLLLGEPGVGGEHLIEPARAQPLADLGHQLGLHPP
jgi:hypothetical protein